MTHSVSVLSAYFICFVYIFFTFCCEIVKAGVSGKLSKGFLAASWKKSCSNLSRWNTKMNIANTMSRKRAIIDFRTMGICSPHKPTVLLTEEPKFTESEQTEHRTEDWFMEDLAKLNPSSKSEDTQTSDLNLDELWQWSLEDLRSHSFHGAGVSQSHFDESPHIFHGLVTLLKKAHWGCKSFFSFSSYGNTGVQVSVVNNELIVGFRGTATIFDLLTDLRIGVEKGPHAVRAHRGFMRTLDSVDHLDKLTNKILQMAQQHNVKRIVCTGYSLGGAVAALYHLKNGETLMKKGFDIRCITFGCPRFIDERDVSLLPLYLTSRIVHTYAEGDPIPLSLTSFLPWRRVKFAHVGHSVVLGERGGAGGVTVSASSWRETDGNDNDSRVKWWNMGCSTWSRHLTENYVDFLHQAERQAQFNAIVQSAIRATIGFGRRLSANVGGVASLASASSPRAMPSPRATSQQELYGLGPENKISVKPSACAVDRVKTSIKVTPILLPLSPKDSKTHLPLDTINLITKRTSSHPSQIDSLANLRRRVTLTSPRPL